MSPIDPTTGIMATARLIREGEAKAGYDPKRGIAYTRYAVRQGDQFLCVDVISGHEADTLGLADERAAELAGSKA